jgi:hypothetical protein
MRAAEMVQSMPTIAVIDDDHNILTSVSIDGELHRISNVYNCAAYSLDSSCEDVVALTARTELSFIYFIRNPIKIDHPVRLDSFQEKITRNKEKVDSILAKINIVPITIERFWVEQTGRTPN